MGPRHVGDHVRDLSDALATVTDILAFDMAAIHARTTMSSNNTLKTLFHSMSKAGIIPLVAATPENLDYDAETMRTWNQGRKKVEPT